MNVGSTTDLGTGGIRFSLPTAVKNDILYAGGTAYMNIGGTVYGGFLQIPGAGSTVAELLRDTSGSVTYNSPAAFGTGDFIRWSATYAN